MPRRRPGGVCEERSAQRVAVVLRWQGGECLLDKDVVRVNKMPYHGSTHAEIIDVPGDMLYGERQSDVRIVYIVSATVCAAKLDADVYVDEARALLKAVGVIDVRRQVAARRGAQGAPLAAAPRS